MIESIPFFCFFFVVHALQWSFYLPNGGLPRALSWVAIVICPTAGGIASCIRFQRRHVFDAVQPLRAGLISIPLILLVVISWTASGATDLQEFNVRMFLNSTSMLTGVSLILVFLWCADVAWIQRVSPWHA